MKPSLILGALLFVVALSNALLPEVDVIARQEKRQFDLLENDRAALRELRESNPALWTSGLLGWDDDMPENNTCLWSGIQCGDDGVISIQLPGLGITTLPESIFQLRRVYTFDFHDNAIVGTLPRTITLGDDRVTFSSINLSNNSFSGNISSDLMKSNLRDLDLSNNQFTGSLPNNLGDMKKLWVLNLSRNQLQGGIPSSFTQLEEMDTLDLSYNQLSGEVPTGMSLMTHLSIINLAGNQFTGNFPDLIALPSLSYLNLAGTSFSGLAPSFLQAYALEADLTGVQFRCPLPACLEGVSCVLSDAPCACPCAFSGGGECVLNSLECACYPHRWGENCAFFCPGNSNSSTVACSGRGNCDSKTGACICDTGFGGDQCEIICPGGPQNPCYGFGTCNQQGVCECDANRDPDSSCSNCAIGYAGPSCEIECLSCDPEHGECDGGLSGTGRCNCFEGYEGVLCEREANTTPIGWLVVGIIMIILFVAAVVLIVAGSYYGWKQYNEYQELKSKDVPMDDMRGRDNSGSESDDSKVGTKRDEDITDI